MGRPALHDGGSDAFGSCEGGVMPAPLDAVDQDVMALSIIARDNLGVPALGLWGVECSSRQSPFAGHLAASCFSKTSRRAFAPGCRRAVGRSPGILPRL